MRLAVHVDMDAFFASIEQLINPSLRGKPVIIGGHPGTRSVVATASYEARLFGVRSGMPTSEAQKLCPHGIFMPGSPARYLHTSVRLYKLLRKFTPRVEPASIDEAYMEIECHEPPMVLGTRILAAIEEELGLTASLGMSESKYLAKVCSPFRKPKGINVLMKGDVREKLWQRRVEVLYGVGEKTAERLRQLGCEIIGDLAAMPLWKLQEALGVYGPRLWKRIHGDDDWRITTPGEAADAKSIGHEHTLGSDIYDRSQIESYLCGLSEKVARRARKAKMAGRRLELKLRDPRFYTTTHGRVLPRAVHSAEDVFAIAKQLLEETQFWRRGVRLLGVSLQKLVRLDSCEQLSFDFEQGSRTNSVVDSIRDKYGEHAIGLARSLERSKRRKGDLSPFPSFQPPQVDPEEA